MFTGIVQTVGRIAAVSPHGDGVRIAVDTGVNVPGDVAIGDSVAVRGCCLTVVAKEGATLTFDVSAETLRCVAGFDARRRVNLERSLRLADRLGGHLVSGHVDGVGRIIGVENDGGSQRWTFRVPASLARYIAAKGSICIDGVSLTVNSIAPDAFGVTLIPHTLAVTTFGTRTTGDPVNLEVDLVARYLERLHA